MINKAAKNTNTLLMHRCKPQPKAMAQRRAARPSVRNGKLSDDDEPLLRCWHALFYPSALCRGTRCPDTIRPSLPVSRSSVVSGRLDALQLVVVGVRHLQGAHACVTQVLYT
jgi:hypothetical protein